MKIYDKDIYQKEQWIKSVLLVVGIFILGFVVVLVLCGLVIGAYILGTKNANNGEEVLIKHNDEVVDNNKKETILSNEELEKYLSYVPLMDEFDSYSFDELIYGYNKDAYSKEKTIITELDEKLLMTIIEKFKGGPVGLDTLAASIGEDRNTIEDVYEPYLLQLGFINRGPRGRIAMPLAYEHLNIPYPTK